MVVLGITGGTGSGKTTALRVFEKMGARAADCDEIYYGLLDDNMEMLNEIADAFPNVCEGKKLDRKKLGKIVFSDKKSLEMLNKITHKYVKQKLKILENEAEYDGCKAFIIDAIALIESGLKEQCDAVIGVLAPREMRAQRLVERENISMEYAQLRIDAQQPDSYYRKMCDYILVNDGDAEQFELNCKTLFSNIMEC